MKKTIIIDIDGCIFSRTDNVYTRRETETLDHSGSKILSWIKEGHMIILMTGRRESFRKETEKQLLEHRIPYDLLIMGVNNGPRIVINDNKPNNKEPMAEAYAIERNSGIGQLDI